MRLIHTSLILLLLSGCATSPVQSDTKTCYRATPAEVSGLFEQWNTALRTGEPPVVVARYAQDSVLLPTLSNTPRHTVAEKVDYFEHFMEKRPVGTIDERHVFVDCNTAVDTGLYTFSFNDGSVAKARYTYTYRRDNGNWLITSHHSSLMPESK
jgi:uncharacterized protein (TIGR02246 family)